MIDAANYRSSWKEFSLADDGLEFETFTSLSEMVTAADVTVLATVESGRLGQSYVSSEDGEDMVDVDVHLQLKVDEVLAGKVGDGSDQVTMVLGPFTGEDVEGVWKDLIGHQAVFALRRSGTKVVNEWGTKPADADVFAQNLYYVVYSRGLLEQDPDGTTLAPWSAERGWITKVTGQPFDEVLADIRAAGR